MVQCGSSVGFIVLLAVKFRRDWVCKTSMLISDFYNMADPKYQKGSACSDTVFFEKCVFHAVPEDGISSPDWYTFPPGPTSYFSEIAVSL